MGCPVAPQRVSGCQWEPDNEGRRLFSHLGTGGLTGWLHGMINGTIGAVDCAQQTTTVNNFDSSSSRTKGCNCTVYLQNGWQFRLEGLSSQRADRCTEPSSAMKHLFRRDCSGCWCDCCSQPAVTLRWQKRVKVLQRGRQIGAFTRLSPLLKCHFYNHASTFYSEINKAHAWINNTGQSGDQNFCMNEGVLKVGMVDHC